MMVFYTYGTDGKLRHDFIRWLGDLICEADVSYWAVPGTLTDEEFV